MSDHFTYKGYVGSAEVDISGEALAGRLLFIRDVITYSAKTVKGLEKAFRDAVDDYLRTCAEEGDAPDVPCKGSFNVRVGHERHRNVAIAARRAELGLNDFICKALDDALRAESAATTVMHIHTMQGPTEQRQVVVTAETPSGWQNVSGTRQH